MLRKKMVSIILSNFDNEYYFSSFYIVIQKNKYVIYSMSLPAAIFLNLFYFVLFKKIDSHVTCVTDPSIFRSKFAKEFLMNIGDTF